MKIQYPPGFADKTELSKNSRRKNWFSPARKDWDDLSTYATRFVNRRSLFTNLSEDEYFEVILYYLCCVTFVDQQVERLMAALRSSPAIENNTYVIVWSDHGFHLAEKLSLSKFTLWERALRVPFLIKGPDVPSVDIEAPVSLLDLFPTMCALAQLPIPAWCDGQALDREIQTGRGAGQDFRLSVAAPSSRDIPKPEDRLLSVRAASPDWNFILHPDGSRELYDRHKDPHEWDNLLHRAARGSRAAEVARDMQSLIPARLAEPVLSQAG